MAKNVDYIIDLTLSDDSDKERRCKSFSQGPSCSGSTVAASTSNTTTPDEKKIIRKRKTVTFLLDNIEENTKLKKAGYKEHEPIDKSKMKTVADEHRAMEKSKTKKAAEEKTKLKKGVGEKEQETIDKSKMKTVADEHRAMEKSKTKAAGEVRESKSTNMNPEEQRTIGMSKTKGGTPAVVNIEMGRVTEEEKQMILEEEALERDAVEQLKVYKPGQCMKYITIEIHPALSKAWYMADLSREAAAAGCKLSVQASVCDPGLIMWTRKLRPTLAADDGQVTVVTKACCNHVLYVCEASAVAELVRDLKLAEHVSLVRDLAACSLTLVVFGANDFFKTNRKTNNSNRIKITDVDLEMALTDLLVSTGCSGVLAETASDLTLLIMQYTKAIAEAPYKINKRNIDEQEDFYMRGEKKDPKYLDSDGNGVTTLWQQMMAVLPNSSLEKSRALCAKYKSPLQLCEALKKPNSIHDLSYLVVSRSNEPNARGRRLGPKFAKKLHMLFTSEDGNMILE